MDSNNKPRILDGPRAINRIEIPQEVADELLQTVILPRLVEEYLDAMDESLDTGVTMEADVSLGVIG